MIDKVEVLLDVDILLYAAMGRVDAPAEFEIACGLLTLNFGLDISTLNQFFVLATSKGKQNLSQDEVNKWGELLSKKPVLSLDSAALRQALQASQAWNISLPDCQMVLCAEKLQANRIYSSLMEVKSRHIIFEQKGIEVINPF